MKLIRSGAKSEARAGSTGAEMSGPRHCWKVLVVDDSAVVRQVVAAVARGIERTAADQSRAIDLAAAQIPGWSATARPNAEAVLAATVQLMALHDGAFDPALDPAQWTAMGRFLDSAGLISASVTPTDAFSNDYAN